MKIQGKEIATSTLHNIICKGAEQQKQESSSGIRNCMRM
jgi:hypothetical protein